MSKIEYVGGGAKASKKLLAAFAILAIAFVVLAAVPAVATDSDATDAKTVYVDGTNGVDDETKDGSSTNPYKSLSYALTKVDNGDTIILLSDLVEDDTLSAVNPVFGGAYGKKYVTINKNVTIKSQSDKVKIGFGLFVKDNNSADSSLKLENLEIVPEAGTAGIILFPINQ